ncbi:MAG: Flp pilus assembly protein CpaB [Planctomycetes bacterium]|nr:Flp pilus assembly protein CpaB [Planctomycetota bacterium]
MGARTVVVIVLSLVCGLAAVLGVSQLRKNGGSAEEVETVPVVVAALDMKLSVVVTEKDVEIKQMPEEWVPEGSFSTIEEVLERTCLTDLTQGDALTEKKLSVLGSGRGLAALIPPGMRAFSIHTPTVGSGVAGFVMPGNKVDVLLYIAGKQGSNDVIAGGSITTLLEFVTVLAVDGNVSAPSDDELNKKKTTRTVTLTVTPDQANKLSLAQKKGTLDLTLRNTADVETMTGRTVRMFDLQFPQEALENSTEDASEDTELVVVAALDIRRGVQIAKNVIVLRRWPKTMIPEGAVRSLDDAIGRVVKDSLLRNDPLIDSELVGKKGGRGGLTPLIPKGMRAYTVLTETIASGVGGFVRPGDRVDVLLTVKDLDVLVSETVVGGRTGHRNEYGGGTATTLLQNVEVLAVDQRLDAQTADKVDPNERLKSVTLLVTPDDANKLSLSEVSGKLHLSLRAEEDDTIAKINPVTIAQLRLIQVIAKSELEATEVQPAKSGGAWLRIRTLYGRQNSEVRVYRPISTTPINAGADGKAE